MKKLILFLFLIPLLGCFKPEKEVCAYCHKDKDPFAIIPTICGPEADVQREIDHFEWSYHVVLTCRYETR